MSELIKLMIEQTGLNELLVRSIISTAPDRYKVFSVPKRRGGLRELSQPAREVKALQRVLLDKVLSRLPVHPAATAYRPGLSIRDNAQVHAGIGPILKFDFAEFFPSIRAQDWIAYCRKSNVFSDEDDIEASASILFRRSRQGGALRLAIGAPSSPALSNALLFEFDRTVAQEIAGANVSYTRYADDLTFSAARTGYLNVVEKSLRGIIHSIKSPKLKLNEEKTVLATNKYKRAVTGLVLSNDGRITIGRERKREIRAAIHYWQCGALDEKSQHKLGGLLSFVQDVEPGFFRTLIDRYGQHVIDDIRRGRA